METSLVILLIIQNLNQLTITLSSSVNRLVLRFHQVQAQLLFIKHRTILLKQLLPMFRRNINNIQAKIQPLRTLNDKKMTVEVVP